MCRSGLSDSRIMVYIWHHPKKRLELKGSKEDDSSHNVKFIIIGSLASTETPVPF